MAQLTKFQNTVTGDIHTVSEELVPMYERKAPEWERLDQPAPAGKNKRRGSAPASQ